FGELCQGRDAESFVACYGSVRKVADPATFQNPDPLRSGPLSARGEYAPLHPKSSRIQFDDAQTTKEILRWVEEVVVVNFLVIPKNPSLRVRVGLRRAAFNLVSQG